MNPRINKEIRTLLPIFAVTTLAPLMVLPLVGFWPWDSVLALGTMASAISCVAMGAMLFGDEFNQRTMTLLLSQPLSRPKIWREKMAVLGSAVALCFVTALLWFFFYIGNRIEQSPNDLAAILFAMIAFALGVFFTVPFWTLQIKSIVGAVVSAVIIPSALLMGIVILVDHYPGLKLPPRWGGETYLAGLVLSLYFGLCYWLGRRTFLRLQVVETQWQELKLPDRVERTLVWPIKKILSGQGGLWGSLINKELHLQRTAFMLAVIFGVLFPSEAVFWKLSKSETALNTAVGFMVATFAIYFLLIPLIAGGSCMAEERNWGMLGWHLSLPASKRSQWFVKVSAALGTSLVLGIIFPIAVFELCKWLFHFPLNPFTNPDSPLENGSDKPGYLICFSMYLVLPCMAILASSLSTNSMRAAVLGLIMTILGFACIQPAGAAAGSVADHFSLRPSSASFHVVRPWICVAVVLILCLTLFMSFRNFAIVEISSRRRWLQPLILLFSIASCVFVLVMEFLSWQ